MLQKFAFIFKKRFIGTVSVVTVLSSWNVRTQVRIQRYPVFICCETAIAFLGGKRAILFESAFYVPELAPRVLRRCISLYNESKLDTGVNISTRLLFSYNRGFE